MARSDGSERGASVVRRTLAAARTELARVGYAALRIDDVAARAKVNKTTIYRRWPTKEALVRAALIACADRGGPLDVPDTGSLRGDLKSLVENKLRFARSAEGSAIIRVISEDPSAELVAITQSLRAARDGITRTILERARARGELRPHANLGLFAELLQLATQRTPLPGHRAGPKYVKDLLDTLLRGVLHSHRNSKLR